MAKKRRRGKPKPTTNKFWSNIVWKNPALEGEANQQASGSSDPGVNPDNLSTSFQTPTSQQESLLELTDDTSPKAPPQAPVKDNKANQQDPQKTPIVLGLNSNSQNKQDSGSNNPPQNNPNTTKASVVQGSAANIKIFNTKTVTTVKVPSSGGAANPQKGPNKEKPVYVLEPDKTKPNITSSDANSQQGPNNTKPVYVLEPDKTKPEITSGGANSQKGPNNEKPVYEPYITSTKTIDARITRGVESNPPKQKKVNIAKHRWMQSAQLASGGIQPQSGQPQIQQPLGVQPQIIQPQMVHPQGIQPQMVQPHSVQPQFVQPQMVHPQGMQPHMVQPQAMQPQMVQAQSMQPQVYQPQNVQPQKYQPTFQSASYTGPNDPFAYSSYPKGIPRSFLVPKNDGVPQPYLDMAQNNAKAWAQTNTYSQGSSSSFIYNFNPAETEKPVYVDTSVPAVEQQAYSPSDAYADNVAGNTGEENREGSESPDMLEPGQKRLSAFQRLGPLTQPKKPKLTINLMCNKDQSIREVVDETEQYVPVHQRDDIVNSKDETVVKFLKSWPWEKGVSVKKTVMARASKSVMLLEHEQMQEEAYDKEWMYIKIAVNGYPRNWTKEKLLDTIMDAIHGKSFVPMFIEFTPQECKFLVNNCRMALNALHKIGLIVRAGDVELNISISQTGLSTRRLNFIPQFVLKQQLSSRYDNEKSLDLSRFTLKEDISHFIYYPLNRFHHQQDLIHIKSNVSWNFLTELNLSHNRITSIDGFNFPITMPKLRHLDLSYNCIEKATLLLRCRELNLHSVKLEGNPLCHDYTDPERYVRVLKMMFPSLREIDGEPIKLYGEMPSFKKNYCPEDAKNLIDKFLEVYFPLLDANDKEKESIEQLYHEKSILTITYRHSIRYNPIYRHFRPLFSRCRVLEEGDMEETVGADDISRLVSKWPPIKHDPFTFTTDVMHHDDDLTIFKVTGVMKLTAETLAEDEPLVTFGRTIALHSRDGVDYKIMNEMLYWDLPTDEQAKSAFQITTVRPKRLSLKLETPPDEDLKEKLVEIFMQLSNLSKSASERCLEHRDWNLKLALEYFTKLVKLDEIDILMKDIK